MIRLENIIEDALKYTNNDKYRLTVAVSRRAVNIVNGEKPLLKVGKNEKPVDIALREIATGLLDVEQFFVDKTDS